MVLDVGQQAVPEDEERARLEDEEQAVKQEGKPHSHVSQDLKN